MRTKGLLLISTMLLAGCAQTGDGGNQSAPVSKAGAGILGSLRPKTDPAVVERLRMEEQARIEKQKALEAAAKQAENQANTDGMGRILPKVSMDPIAPPAEDVANPGAASSTGPIFTPANSGGQSPIPVPGGSPQVAMTYGAPPPPSMYGGGGGGGMSQGGLVPPPPAVTLSTQASVGSMPAGMPMDPSAMYSNPYMNPYGVPMPMQNMSAMVPPVPSMPMGHSPESLFGSGGRRSSGGGDDDDAGEKKRASFAPIIPTGMESRSAYRQRDDMKALWNGVLNTNVMSALMKDGKFASELKTVEVGLPGEASKGSFAVSQRQVDAVFKNASLDKRILSPVHKVQTDLVQAYYRYLYSYNKYALASQTLKARKQEADVANSDSEKQRAIADQSQAQSEADSAKDDMVSAQQELASVAGGSAAKYVVSRVSGAAMSTEVASADAPSKAAAKNSGGGGGGMFGMFHFGGGGAPEKPAAAAPTEDAKVASAPAEKKKEKEPKKGKGKKDSSSSKEKDLAPAPESASNDSGVSEAAAAAPPANSNGISFELKNVNTTARKSILTVSIKNGGANNFSFSPDVISISEGNHKLAEAAVRADFDQTMVQPNQEIKGTITIFGRPWNERLIVSLSEGGKTINMSRR